VNVIRQSRDIKGVREKKEKVSRAYLQWHLMLQLRALQKSGEKKCNGDGIALATITPLRLLMNIYTGIKTKD
jgi:hypothetical protein